MFHVEHSQNSKLLIQMDLACAPDAHPGFRVPTKVDFDQPCQVCSYALGRAGVDARAYICDCLQNLFSKR